MLKRTREKPTTFVDAMWFARVLIARSQADSMEALLHELLDDLCDERVTRAQIIARLRSEIDPSV